MDAFKTISKRNARTYADDSESLPSSAASASSMQSKRASRVSTVDEADLAAIMSFNEPTAAPCMCDCARGRADPVTVAAVAGNSRHVRTAVTIRTAESVVKQSAVACAHKCSSAAIASLMDHVQSSLLQNSKQDLELGIQMSGRPANFGMVLPGLYRSSYPEKDDFDFLRTLRLKSVVTLVDKEIPVAYVAFMRSNGIKHHVIGMDGTKKQAIPVPTMRSILRIILDRRNHPVLIHCNHGKHRTGCVVGIVRRLTGWSHENIVSEYHTFAKPKARDCDLAYIDEFDLSMLSNIFTKDPNATKGGFPPLILVFIVVLAVLLYGTTVMRA